MAENTVFDSKQGPGESTNKILIQPEARILNPRKIITDSRLARFKVSINTSGTLLPVEDYVSLRLVDKVTSAKFNIIVQKNKDLLDTKQYNFLLRVIRKIRILESAEPELIEEARSLNNNVDKIQFRKSTFLAVSQPGSKISLESSGRALFVGVENPEHVDVDKKTIQINQDYLRDFFSSSKEKYAKIHPEDDIKEGSPLYQINFKPNVEIGPQDQEFPWDRDKSQTDTSLPSKPKEIIEEVGGIKTSLPSKPGGGFVETSTETGLPSKTGGVFVETYAGTSDSSKPGGGFVETYAGTSVSSKPEDKITKIYNNPFDDPVLKDLEKQAMERANKEYDLLKASAGKEGPELDWDEIHYQKISGLLDNFKYFYPEKAIIYAGRYKGLGTDSSGFKPLSPGEAFSQPMPDFDLKDKDLKKFRGLYGKYFGTRAYSKLYRLNDNETTFFQNPKLTSNAYETEFLRKFGGKVGLPKFKGYVPGGYQTEAFEGKSLQELINEARDANNKGLFANRKTSRTLKNIITKEQGQKIINLLAEYQTTTSTTHGFSLDKIIITPEGDIKLAFPGYYRNNKLLLSPKEEIRFARESLKKQLGVNTKAVKTISKNQARRGQKEFVNETNRLLIKDPKDINRYVSYRESPTNIKIDSSSGLYGRYLIRTSTPSPSGGVPIPQAPVPDTSGGVPIPQTPVGGIPTGKSVPGRSSVRQGIKTAGAAAGAAIGNAIAPVIGTALGKVGAWVGDLAGQAISDPIGFIKRMAKYAAIALGFLAAAAFSFIVEILIGIVVFIFVVVIILFIINSGAYVVPQGGFAQPGENPYIRVTKTVDNPGPFDNSWADQPRTLNYTITIYALRESLTGLSFNYSCNVVSNNSRSCPVPQGIIAGGQPSASMPPTPPSTITASQPYVITYQTLLQGGGYYHDSLITDRFTVTASILGQQESSSGSRSIRIGNPPDTCPNGWPILPEGQESFLGITQGPQTTISHTNAEAIDVGATEGHTITARASGIVHVNAGQTIYYGCHVDIESTCNGEVFVTRYAHLDDITVNDGDTINMGDEIGLSGGDPYNSIPSCGTGNTTGGHLHYEFRNSSSNVKVYPNDPPPYMEAGYDWGGTIFDFIPNTVTRGCEANCGTIP